MNSENRQSTSQKLVLAFSNLPKVLNKWELVNGLNKERQRETAGVQTNESLENSKEQNEIYRCYKFGTYEQAFDFVQQANELIVKQDHHPRWQNNYNQLEVWLTTKDAGNRVSSKDIRLAESFENLWLTKYQ